MNFEDLATQLISKLDINKLLIILPIIVCIYVLFFIDNADIEKTFTQKQIITEKHIKCPTCGDTITINEMFLKKYEIKTNK